MALVVYSDSMPSLIHDAVMECVQSDVGQQAENLADALQRKSMPDGRIALTVLHQEGYIKKVQTNQVIMTPNAKSTVRLDELNDVVSKLKNKVFITSFASNVARLETVAYVAKEIYPMERPSKWHHPFGFGTLGYALPAAIGGKIGKPNKPVVAIMGDYGFHYTMQELGVAVELKLGIPIIIWDNEKLKAVSYTHLTLPTKA